MASLLRNCARQGCRSLSKINHQSARFKQPALFLSTSKKNKDSASIPFEGLVNNTETNTESKTPEDDPNWMSYGFSYTDREMDAFGYNMVMFMGISVVGCFCAFIVSYLPDHKLRHWSRREAHLELARRERDGLPLIDINLIPAEKFDLPTDEELGPDFEIII